MTSPITDSKQLHHDYTSSKKVKVLSDPRVSLGGSGPRFNSPTPAYTAGARPRIRGCVVCQDDCMHDVDIYLQAVGPVPNLLLGDRGKEV